ncbi:MAG: DUF6934 family protein [Chitinophagales bacterium]
MASKGYNTTRKSTTRYEFISIGPKGKIAKRIEFTPLRKRGYYNVAFGDVMKNGRVNDIVYSGNQDIVKVISTVIDTVKDFLKENPTARLVFTGSTDDRTRFYRQILSRHHEALSAHYIITALVEDNSGSSVEVGFDVNEERNYLAFLVRNKM